MVENKNKFRFEYVNLVPNDREYRSLFHISKNSFVVLLEYLKMEEFFRKECITSRKQGRLRRIEDGTILLGIISYFTMSNSLIQSAFRCGIN